MLSAEDCELRHKIGVDKLMWGSDYPHLEGTWPKTREALQATFGPVEQEHETRAILGENAARIFGFDLELMHKTAERVGPTLDELH
jgi:predicted TIM-barrel fold metal-dependent hydrolase